MVSEITKNIVTTHFVRIIIGLLAFVFGVFETANASFVDYAENTELLQQSIGDNITLHCSLKGIISENKDIIKYLWYFKQCGESSGGTAKCYDANDDEDWTQLPCEDNFCNAELRLKNVTEKYSGLYKCSVMPNMGTSLVDVKLVRTFQLDIRNISRKVPEFLDSSPVNQSASLGAQVVFQCRVLSEEYPTIKWFRRLSHHKYVAHENLHSIVYYSGRAYELLTAAREKPVGRDLYLSKLILSEVRAEDEGFYACVAISVLGHNIREAYLQIYAADDLSLTYWSDYSDETEDAGGSADPNKFWLFFLMPVGLAILPLSVWLCYILHKRCRHKGLKVPANYSEEQSYADQQRMLRA